MLVWTNTSTIVPTKNLKLEHRSLFRRYTQERLKERARDIGSLDVHKHFVLRDLRSVDFGMTHGWLVPTNQYRHCVTFINYNLNPHQMIGIYGILQLGVNPAATVITLRKGSLGAITLGTHNLDAIYAELPILKQLSAIVKSKEDLQVLLDNKDLVSSLQGHPMEGYFAEPYIYHPNDTVNIEVSLREPSDDYLVLLGYVYEAEGLTII